MAKYYVRSAAALCLLAVLLVAGCSKGQTAEERAYARAQEIFTKRGFDKFVEYVGENGYYAVVDDAGATPLLLAIKNGDTENAAFFLEKGASPDEKDAAGLDALDYALQNAGAGAMDFVLSVMPASYWNTALSDGNVPLVKIICNSDYFDGIRRAVDLTRNLEAADRNGKTLLMYAAQCNIDVRVTKLLLDKQVDMNRKERNQWSALMYAARYNPNPAVMEDLLLRGADANANFVGLSVTMLAACNPNAGVLFVLLRHIDDVNARTDNGKTALMYACENAQPPSAIRLLIDGNADVNASDNNGKTALMYACEHYATPDSIYLLLAAGADSNASDNASRTVRAYFSANAALRNSDLANALNLAERGNAASGAENASADSAMENDNASDAVATESAAETADDVISENSTTENAGDESADNAENVEATDVATENPPSF